MINQQRDLKQIAAVVILYNPEYQVIKNITSYLDSIDFLFIVDNSEQKNLKISQAFSSFQKIEFINNNVNLGVAKALNLAIDKAIKAGFKYLLTMDQDSYFDGESLKKLLIKMPDEKVGIYSPFHKNKFFTNPPQNESDQEVSDVMTSGNILNLSVINKVGNFKEDYFIDYVDIEFCLRLRLNGFKVIRNNGSFLIHNEANLEKKILLGKIFYPPNHSAIRWYYKIRNYLYLKKEYLISFPEYFNIEKLNIRNNIFKVLLFEKNKFTKIQMMIKGRTDYLKNIKGKFSA